MAAKAIEASCAGNTAKLRKTKLCKYFESLGECGRGDACSFAHGTCELQSCPNLHKTQLCLAFQRFGHCRDGSTCKYAHGDADLQANAQHPGHALPKPVGLQAGSVATAVVPVPVRVPVPAMLVISTSMLPIGSPTSGTSSWPMQSMTIPSKDEKLTCSATADDPDTPSTTCPCSWVSEASDASDSASSFSSEPWSRQLSEVSCQSNALEASVDHDEIQMPEIEFQTSNPVSCDPVEEAGSPETEDVALNIALHRTKLCSFHQRGVCKLGHSCKFAHDLEDLRSRPNLYRTNPCFAFSRGRCRRGDTCKYAHGLKQFQGNSVQDFVKTTEFQVSQFDMAGQGGTDKKTMRLEIARAVLERSSSKVTDVGIALGVQVTVKNTFFNFNVCRLVERRRSV